ncbi:CocE/NonD family hydrolase [Acidobacteria bacterium AB60]|nr:CocE/NonD family hydrolase [Acidobacteria bacterium AB60]
MLQNAFRISAFALLATSFALAQSAAPIVERNVTMKTRDGVTLKADIYRPAGDGPFPVLLTRTPYNKDGMSPIGRDGAARGFMMVLQDTRGRYASEGEWYPFKHEIDDGYDAVEWAAALPHANGKVGMFSGSYVGATQMLAAIAHPPHLAAICPIVTASNYHENWTYQGGAFEQWFNESWTGGLAQDTLNRKIVAASNATLGDKVLPLTQFPLFNTHFDPGSPAATKDLAPYFLDWLAHPLYDDYWKQWSIEENYPNIQVPALHVAAWYDIFLGGSLRNYMGLHAHAGNENARNGQHLMVIIGGHSGNGRTVGEVDFGPDAPFNENNTILDFYDYLFLGKQNEFANGKPVKIFVMGKNEWRFEDAWPLARAKDTRYFLASEGKANTASGDGALTTSAGSHASDTFVYDPANPVPTIGGPLCCDSQHLAPGPRDQKEAEARPDVLVYSTPPLDQDLEVTGPITLDLFAKSSAPDTDFTGKLVDVYPDGRAINLTEGILRARFRESTTHATPIEPGRVYEYKIDLWATSNVFLKGHRIRLEVSSSNFPRFDRNLNTGKSAADSTAFVKATNTVLHDSEHPSALILPVIPQ